MSKSLPSVPVLNSQLRSQLSAEVLALVDLFQTHVAKSKQEFAEACTYYVAAVDMDHRVLDLLLDNKQAYDANYLSVVDRVGRGTQLVDLVFDSSPGAKCLFKLSIDHKMPIAQQAKIYENPIPVVTKTEDRFVVVEKNLSAMTRAEVKQVFNEDKIRPADEQLKILKDRPSGPTRVAVKPLRYSITTEGKLLVHEAGMEFTIEHLEKILDKMRQAAIRTLGATIKSNQLRPRK